MKYGQVQLMFELRSLRALAQNPTFLNTSVFDVVFYVGP